MNLAFLSFVRLTPICRVPHVPTNAERLQAFRASVPNPPLDNRHPWPHRAPQPKKARA